MSRPARALIDLDALRHNYRTARTQHGGRALAVMKANAYGHGVVPCARALAAEADGYAVAFLDEALVLRTAGLTHPILILEGLFSAAELALAVTHDLWFAVHQEEQVRMLEQADLPAASLNVWLKVDTGMHRVGFDPAAVAAVHQRLLATGKVAAITFMSHFARSDEVHSDATLRQITCFEAATAGLPGARSLCNSSAVLAWPQAHRDWARPGILLYGADPTFGAGTDLQPVMTLDSAIFATRELDIGEPVGYGARFVAQRRTRVGLVAMGYADGYPRNAPDGTPVTIDGIRSTLIGRVSMDMLSVDLTDLPQAGIGSRVELWGKQVPVNDVATAAGTIAYELLCNVKRVPFQYTGA